MKVVYAIVSKKTNEVKHWVGADGKHAGLPMIYATFEHAKRIMGDDKKLTILPVPLFDTADGNK